MKKNQHWKLILAAILIALAIVFVFQNREAAQIEFLVWTWNASRAVALFTVFLVGTLVGWLGRGAAAKRKKSQL